MGRKRHTGPKNERKRRWKGKKFGPISEGKRASVCKPRLLALTRQQCCRAKKTLHSNIVRQHCCRATGKKHNFAKSVLNIPIHNWFSNIIITYPNMPNVLNILTQEAKFKYNNSKNLFAEHSLYGQLLISWW